MATIDTSYVRKELRAICDKSQALKHLLRQALDTLKATPTRWKRLESVPNRIKRRFKNATIRKYKLESNPHSYRLIAVHWSRKGQEDHCDVILAFPRKDGYQIDWDLFDSLFGDDNE